MSTGITADEIREIEFQMDLLQKRLDKTANDMDALAMKLETKRTALAFEQTAYTPEETRPVSFFSIVECDEVQTAAGEPVTI